jgi:hypothetical protein
MRQAGPASPHHGDDTTGQSREARVRPATIAIAAAGAALLVAGHVLIATHARPLSDLWYSFVWFGFVLAADAIVAARCGASLLTTRRGELAFMLLASAALWWGFELLNVRLLSSWSYTASPDISMTAQRLRSSLAFASLVPSVLQAGMLASMVASRVRRASRPASRPRKPYATRVLVALAMSGFALLALAWLLPTFALPLALVGLFLSADATNAARGRPSLLERALSGDCRFAGALFGGNVVAGVIGEGWNYWADPKWRYDVPYADTFKIFEMPWPGYAGYGFLALALFALYHAVRPRFRRVAMAPGHPLAECGLD